MTWHTVTLRDAATGSRAHIAPQWGFNCYGWQCALPGEEIDVLWAAPDFPDNAALRSKSGIPLLFPFPGRLRGTRFVYQGREYVLHEGDGRGNAIHGLVHNRPWRVVEQTEQRVVGCFHAAQADRTLRDRWPADFRLTVSYELQGCRLRCAVRVENPDQTPLPWGFGAHPYFRVPLGRGGNPATTRLVVPAREYWELEHLLPTGRRLPVDAARDLQAGKLFPQLQLDDVLTSLKREDGWCRCVLEDLSTLRRLIVRFDDAFAHCVVFNPPHRQAVCIEPYTCVPGVFGDVLQGTAPPGMDAGIRYLEPGQHADLQFELEVA
jgi:aldose 1-epimerase